MTIPASQASAATRRLVRLIQACRFGADCPSDEGRVLRRRAYLLDHPAVAVRIGEGQERVVTLPRRVRAGRLAALLEVEDLARLDAASRQVGVRVVDIGH